MCYLPAWEAIARYTVSAAYLALALFSAMSAQVVVNLTLTRVCPDVRASHEQALTPITNIMAALGSWLVLLGKLPRRLAGVCTTLHSTS